MEQELVVDFSISDPVQFDALFQIYATPDAEKINQRIDEVVEELEKTVQDIQGSETVDVTRNGQSVTLATKTFIFEQGIASDVWTIEHNLNKYPSITLVDSSGRQFVAEVEYNNFNLCTVHLNGATTGKAYLN